MSEIKIEDYALDKYDEDISNIEKLLNDVDYTFKGLVPSKESLMFINFIKEVNNGFEENESPIMHIKMLESMFSKNPQSAIMCHRGAAKSSLIEYLVLFVACFGYIPNFGKVNLMLYVSDSIENGAKNFRRNIQYRYENSDYLKKMIPNIKIKANNFDTGEAAESDMNDFDNTSRGIKFTDIRLEFMNYNNHRTIVKSYGVSTGVRGCTALDEVLYTDTGTVTMKDVQVGDMVFTPYGTPAQVIDKSPVKYDDMYQLEFADGRKLKVSHDHLNTLVYKRHDGKLVKTNIETIDLITKKLKTGSVNHWFTEIPKPPEYTEKTFAISPYLLGLSLSDGYMPYSKGLRLSGLSEDINSYKKHLSEYDYSEYPFDERSGTSMIRLSFHGLTEELRQSNIAGVTSDDKFIPTEYLYGSVKQRRDLLAGLLDTDGTCSKDGRVSFSNVSEKLADGIMELARGLGYYVSKSISVKDKTRKPLHRVYIRGTVNPFYLKRKADRFKVPSRFKNIIPLKSITKIPNEENQCIVIDHPEHEYLTSGYMTTHNTKELGTRPQVAFLDDLISKEEDARSTTIMQNVKDTIYKDIVYALSPKNSKIIYLGTPFNQNDPLYEAVNSGAWDTAVYPVCEQFDSSTTKEDFKGSWEDRFPYEYVKKKYETALAVGQPQSFYQELMLQINSDDDRLVQEGNIIWYKNVDSIRNNKSAYNFYITTDFAVSSKASADFSCINVWAYSHDKKWYWVDGFMEKADITDTFDSLFKLAEEYKPKSVGIESSGQQGGFISLLVRDMSRNNIYFNIQREYGKNSLGIRPTTDKISRFQEILPQFVGKRILFPADMRSDPRMKEMVNELRSITRSGYKSRHDDMGDTVAMLSKMTPIAPTLVDKSHDNKKSTKPMNVYSKYFKNLQDKSDNSLEDYIY